MKTAFYCAAWLLLLTAIATPSARAAESNQTNITVELLIFSGRPNPTWQLQDTNILHTLKTRLKDLPVAFEKEPAEWSRLGFAGFRIHGGETIGLPGEIQIFQGVIKTGKGRDAKFLKDSGLEQKLIAEAKQQQSLAPPIRSAITNYENARKAAQ